MTFSFPAQTLSPDQALALIDRCLATPWKADKPLKPGETARVFTLGPDNGPSALLATATTKGRRTAGEWNGLAAVAYSRLCKSEVGHGGVAPWSVASLLAPANRTKPVKCHHVPYRGLLSPTLGQQWRPGISLDGLLMLALLGQRGSETKLRGSPFENALEKAEIEDFRQACGIGDMKEWAVGALDDAVSLTQHWAATNPSSYSLGLAWTATLQRLTKWGVDVAQALPEERRFDLLLSLINRFKSTQYNYHSFDESTRLLFPGIQEGQKPLAMDAGFETVLFRASLLKRLMLFPSPDEAVQTLEELSQVRRQLPDQTLAVIQAWVDSNRVPNYAKLTHLQGMVHAWRLENQLEQRLEEPVPAARPKMRM